MSIADNRKNWSDFEDKAISTLVKRHGTKNWAEISEKMSSKYGIDNRTGKQCRERWHNHLDPSINKQTWSSKEQKMMFQAHQKYGNKWTEIAKMFQGRTDNDIKNHFYSMLRRSLRRINKMLGRRNSTQKIKVIKPSVLSKIFINIGVKDEKKSEECKKISEALFEFSNSKPDSELTQSLDFEERKRLEKLIEKLSQYNDEYEQSQLLKRQSKKSQNQQSQIKIDVAPQPAIIKNESQVSSLKGKSKKKNRISRKQSRVKQQTKEEQGEQDNNKKSKKQGKKDEKHQPLLKIQQKNDQNDEIQKGYMTRLRKSQSGLSFGEEFILPDLNGTNELNKISSSSQEGTIRFKKNSSNFIHSPGFGMNSTSYNNNNLFTAPSPRGQFRNWTPLCPSPNMGDLFSRGMANYQWKDNNEDLDNIMNQLRRKIEQSSKPQ